MEAGLREVCRSVRIGKILIQRARKSYWIVTQFGSGTSYQDEETAQAKLFYSKARIASAIASRTVINTHRSFLQI
jgi:hypothetical protein